MVSLANIVGVTPRHGRLRLGPLLHFLVSSFFTTKKLWIFSLWNIVLYLNIKLHCFILTYLLNSIEFNTLSNSGTIENKFNCKICNKEYSSLGQLLNHKWIHDEPNSHKCKVCGKVFNSKCHLNSHVRIHNMW